MTQYVIVEQESSRVRGFVDQDETPDPVEGCLIAENVNPVTHYPEAPTATSVLYWRDGALAWEESATLGRAQEAAWDRVKAARDAAEVGVFTFEGDVYDINKANVSGAALAALMAQLAGQPYSVEWTLADNTTRMLDGAAMQRLGIALVEHVDGLHATGRELRARIEAATTIEEAYAVTWPNEEPNNVEPAAPAA